MDNRFQFAPSVLRDGVVALCAFDAAGVCVARESRSALEAYTSEIDLIDEPSTRRGLSVRRIVAEQSASRAGSPATRWSMAYDADGTLTDAVEHVLGRSELMSPASLADTGARLAQRLRWIGVPGEPDERK